MTERRRGLGRGLGALIPTRTPEGREGPTDPHPRHDEHTPSPDSTNGVTHDQHEPDPAETDRAETDRADIGAEARAEADHASAPSTSRADEVPSAPTNAAAGVAHFAELPLTSISTNPRQPRQVFDEDALEELADSIREVGVLQPIVVRELAPANGAHRYELVMGERRWRAALVAGLATVPAIVRETSDDALLRDALLENLHRAQLNPLEEAAAYDQLLADFGCTQEELARRIGRSRPQISNTLRLLRLPPGVQRRVASGVLTAGHARALLGLDDRAAQERMAQRIVAEGLSVRTVEELVAMGDLGPADRAPRRAHAPVAPALVDLGARLSERFETRVKVDLGRRKGKITIEFASIADLERIVAVIDLQPDQRPREDGGSPHFAESAENA